MSLVDWLEQVTGDSIYNLLHFNELELDASDRPVYPPVIKSVTVLWNPFEDIVPREIIKAETEKPAAKPKRPKVKCVAYVRVAVLGCWMLTGALLHVPPTTGTLACCRSARRRMRRRSWSRRRSRAAP